MEKVRMRRMLSIDDISRNYTARSHTDDVIIDYTLMSSIDNIGLPSAVGSHGCVSAGQRHCQQGFY